MTCFQLIKSVLDYAYSQIPGNDTDKKDAIAAQLLELRGLYKGVMAHGSLDYSDPVRRFAYVYMYTGAHADMVYQLCRMSDAIEALFRKSDLTVAAIGGGPGSDFLGLLKYCEKESVTPTLRIQVYDRDPTWGETWGDVGAKITGTGTLSSVFTPLDVCDPNSWMKFSRYKDADLITLVYFLSEIYKQQLECKAFFDHLLSSAKKGAVFLFLDNADSRLTAWVDGLAGAHGFTVEKKADETKLQMCYDEEARDLNPYFSMLGYPKLQGNVAYRLAIKR